MSHNSTSTLRENRLSIRTSAPDKTLLEEAARVRRMNMSQFVLESSLDAARAVLADQSEFRLSPKEWEEFCLRLDAPPRTIPALVQLFSEADPFQE